LGWAVKKAAIKRRWASFALAIKLGRRCLPARFSWAASRSNRTILCHRHKIWSCRAFSGSTVEGRNANTRDRFIYIHGTKHEDKIGKPDSHGCIRMRNADVIELFELVDVDTPVTVKE